MDDPLCGGGGGEDAFLVVDSTMADPQRSPVPPPGKRLAPVGACHEDELASCSTAAATSMLQNKTSSSSTLGSPLAAIAPANIGDQTDDLRQSRSLLERRLKEMEEEQEELNNSLMGITSHFAKVQLRLQQVVNAPVDKREDLLRELEHFAFRGIPDLNPKTDEGGYNANSGNDDDDEGDQSATETDPTGNAAADLVNAEILATQRRKHQELIHQLKRQLEDLESYAYESGESIVPSNMLMQRQKIVMDELKSRLNLNTDNLIELSEEQLKAEVDSAVSQLINPLKMKCHLVNQLKTQITDLEMFIAFLQRSESAATGPFSQDCRCSKHQKHTSTAAPSLPSTTMSDGDDGLHDQTVSILQKAMAVLQLAAISQFGCGVGLDRRGTSTTAGTISSRPQNDAFAKNKLKGTRVGNHFGDLRARLELAVDHTLDVCSRTELSQQQESSSASIEPEVLNKAPQITVVVRKELATAIRDLMEHGLIQDNGVSGASGMVPFLSCMSNRSRGAPSGHRSSSSSLKASHAWSVVVRYYHLKRGHEFNSAPQRKLSQSFGLDLDATQSSHVPATPSNKNSLLATVGQILLSHGAYKRSNDSQFKAFVCAGLNSRKLIPWLKLILRNQTLIENSYYPWSYVVKTGFDDAFRALDRLSIYVFDIPVDTAVRQFQDLEDAF